MSLTTYNITVTNEVTKPYPGLKTDSKSQK